VNQKLEQERLNQLKLEKRQASLANKNKLRDRLMSEHLDYLRNYRVWN
jgi:hypothetical protein